jgi:hypothetical protein
MLSRLYNKIPLFNIRVPQGYDSDELLSSRNLRCVVWYIFIDVSKERATTVFVYSEDEGRDFFRNLAKRVPDFTAPYTLPPFFLPALLSIFSAASLVACLQGVGLDHWTRSTPLLLMT